MCGGQPDSSGPPAVGGGAVYHDLGNVNFTFIADHTGSGFGLLTFCRPVIWALEDLGVPAELNGRNT